MQRGTWGDAIDVWEYIKSRRRCLPPELNDEEKETLGKFLEESRSDGIFLLRRGSLEEYLPAGLRDKDIEKLISFVKSDDFWENLPSESLGEIEEIARELLKIRPPDVSIDNSCDVTQ